MAREAQRPVTGRLFHVPDWNYDHGYGDYRLWLDHDLPDELEAAYRRLEAVLPDYWRAGLARAPFDVERVVFASGMERRERSRVSRSSAGRTAPWRCAR